MYNIKDLSLLRQHWPTLSCGKAITTTRTVKVAQESADVELKVKSFNVKSESQLLINLLLRETQGDSKAAEWESAFELSRTLYGHALAICHVAKLIY